MELLITVLTLLAAIYAVVPRVRQLDIKLRIGLLDQAVVLLACVSVLYLEFNEFCQARGWVLRRPWPTGITPRNTIYLILLSAAAILVFHHRFTRLTRRKVPKFRQLVEQLYWEESFGELFTLLERHLTELFAIAGSQSRWVRIRGRLGRMARQRNDSEFLRIPEHYDVPARPDGRKGFSLLWVGSFAHWVRRPFAAAAISLLPRGDTAQEAGEELLRATLLSPRLVKALVRTRPYLGLNVIRLWRSHERFDFIDAYVTELLRDTTSVLYQELRNNQNVSGSHRYMIPSSNRVIHFFLADANFANEINIWKPVGDYATNYLDELARDARTDPYNRAMGNFREAAVWNSPLFATIRFFDIMVMEALYQNIEWHMWLYYMPIIVEKIVRNYRIADPLADPDSEWPIRYSFLLYQIFSSMRYWIESVADVPLEQANVVLRSTGADHDNGNIPKSAILALCECSRDVLESENVSSKFKRYLIDIVFTEFFKLKSDVKLQGYATVLRNAISQGGSYKRRTDATYRAALLTAFRQERTEYTIKYPEEHVSELEDALK